MKVRILALIFSILFIIGCEKEEITKTVVNSPQTEEFKYVILDEEDKLSIGRSGPEAVFGRGNLVYDNYLEAGPDTPRTIIAINTFKVRNVTLTPSEGGGSAYIQGVYCGKYDSEHRWKQSTEIPIKFYKDYTRYVGDTVSTFQPSSANNVLISSSAVNAIKYILIGYGPMIIHPYDIKKVPIGIFERYQYLNGEWLLIEVVNLHPNNKANIFNIPLLL